MVAPDVIDDVRAARGVIVGQPVEVGRVQQVAALQGASLQDGPLRRRQQADLNCKSQRLSHADFPYIFRYLGAFATNATSATLNPTGLPTVGEQEPHALLEVAQELERRQRQALGVVEVQEDRGGERGALVRRVGPFTFCPGENTSILQSLSVFYKFLAFT